jgi:hypothetical protein
MLIQSMENPLAARSSIGKLTRRTRAGDPRLYLRIMSQSFQYQIDENGLPFVAQTGSRLLTFLSREKLIRAMKLKASGHAYDLPQNREYFEIQQPSRTREMRKVYRDELIPESSRTTKSIKISSRWNYGTS